jgi:hypothetical protein
MRDSAEAKPTCDSICTYQHYTTRCFESASEGSATEAQLLKAAQAYITAMEAQTGLVGAFEIASSDDDMVIVDMENWPAAEGFGDWFQPLMQSHNVQIHD